jgi:hypothetical protein
MACHPDRAVAAEGLRISFLRENAGMLLPLLRDQHDSLRPGCVTYLGYVTLVSIFEFPVSVLSTFDF